VTLPSIIRSQIFLSSNKCLSSTFIQYPRKQVRDFPIRNFVGKFKFFQQNCKGLYSTCPVSESDSPCRHQIKNRPSQTQLTHSTDIKSIMYQNWSKLLSKIRLLNFKTLVSDKNDVHLKLKVVSSLCKQYPV